MENKEMFEKLSKLDPKHIKTLTKKWNDKKTGEQKSMSQRYITARTVMNMLDSIVGPENWRADYKPLSDTVMACTLYLRIDGEWIGKTDVGTPSDIEPEKGAVSDAFKRAAVHWGIGRELYNEGTASFDDDEPAQKPAPQTRRIPQPAPEVKPAVTENGQLPVNVPGKDMPPEVENELDNDQAVREWGDWEQGDGADHNAAREMPPVAGGDELSTPQNGSGINLEALRAKVWPSWSGQTSFYAMTIQDMENKKIKWTGPFWLGMKKHAPDWKEDDVHTLLGCAMHDFKGPFGDLLLKIVAALPEAQVPA